MGETIKQSKTKAGAKAGSPHRHDPAETKKRILLAPAHAWSAEHHSDKPALSYALHTSVAGGQEHVLRSLLGGNDFLDLSAVGQSTMYVTHSWQQTTRVDIHGKSVLGSDCTFIQDSKLGNLYFDTKSHTYLHLPPEVALSTRYTEKFRGSVKVHDTEHGTTAVLMIEAPYRVKYELKLDTRDEFRPFAKTMVCHVIGCSDKFLGAGLDLSPIVERGIPVAGTTYLVQADGAAQAVTSFEVKDLKLDKVPAGHFNVPDGYVDLRKRGSDSGKRHTVQIPLGRGGADAVAGQSGCAACADCTGSATAACPTGRCHIKPYESVASLAPSGLTRGTTIDVGGLVGTPGYASGGNGAGAGGGAGDGGGDYGQGSLKMLASKEQRMPRCFADETYGSLIANLVDEKLLDDVKFLANGVSRRLTGFTGDHGKLNIDWMKQFQTFSNALDVSDPGGGLYTMLHDEDALSASHPRKLGLLDRLAVSNLAKLLESGDTLASLGLAAGLQAAVNAVIANGAIAAADRFTSLTQAQQSDLIDAYVFKGIGTLALTYPESTGTQSVFHDLLNVRLDDIKFAVAINNTSIIKTLDFDNAGVHLNVALPDASGQAFLTRWPSTLYWEVLGISGLACIFLPFLCGLTGLVILVGLFLLLDLADISIDLANPTVDAHITLTPNGANVLQPSVSLTLSATVNVTYLSVIPDGVHQILSLIYTIIGDQTNIILDTLQDQLQTSLNDFLRGDLGVSYPPAFGPVPLAGVANATEFVADDRGYVEQALDAGFHNLINPYVTQIDSEVKSKILALRDEFKASFTDPVTQFTNGGGLLAWPGTDFAKVARYYGGTVLSQNFVNQYVYTIWLAGDFTYQFAGTELAELYAMLQQVYPALAAVSLADSGLSVKLWPAVPPRTVFTPKPASEGKYYATTFFDDVRLCLSYNSDIHAADVPGDTEYVFATEVTTEIGFGALDTSTHKLDLLKLGDRAFDIYFDLTGLGVKVIVPETERLVRPNAVATVHGDYSVLGNPKLQALFARATLLSLAKRDKRAIPRAVGDDPYIQRYPLGDPSATAVFVLVPFQGNLYVSHGMSGLATAIYEGALNIDTFTRLEALLIRAAI